MAVAGASAGLLLAAKADGTGLREVDAPGYRRQKVVFEGDECGLAIFNSEPVVFQFDEQPTFGIPLIGLFIGKRLALRGAVKRLTVPPIGLGGLAPQVRLEAGALTHKRADAALIFRPV